MKSSRITKTCALALAVLLLFASLTALAVESIVLGPGEKEFSYTVRFGSISDPYASAQFDVIIDNGNLLEKENVVFESDLIGVVSEGHTDGNQVTYKIGVTTTADEIQNILEGNRTVCTITFAYKGEEPCRITIKNFELLRKTSSTVYTRESKDWEFVIDVTSGEQLQVASPTAVPAPGRYAEKQTVILSSTTIGAKIYYTTDGTDPTSNSTLYTGPITVEETTTIKAIAVKEGYNSSSIATFNYTISSSGPDTPGGPGGETGDDPPTSEDKAFQDLSGFDWALDAINNLAERGIIKGDGKGNFMPGNAVTRADFVLMIYRLAKLEAETRSTFNDLPASQEYIDAIENAAGCGIVLGIGDDRFDPSSNIKRQDAIVIAYRLLKYLGKDLADSNTSLSAFGDASTLSDYAYEAMTYMVGKGIIIGSNGNLEPIRPITRAEIAVLLYRMINEFEL